MFEYYILSHNARCLQRPICQYDIESSPYLVARARISCKLGWISCKLKKKMLVLQTYDFTAINRWDPCCYILLGLRFIAAVLLVLRGKMSARWCAAKIDHVRLCIWSHSLTNWICWTVCCQKEHVQTKEPSVYPTLSPLSFCLSFLSLAVWNYKLTSSHHVISCCAIQSSGLCSVSSQVFWLSMLYIFETNHP